MNKRLQMLKELVASGKADSFARYALALEYRNIEQVNDALRQFEELREQDPEYLPMYLMAGQMLIAVGQTEAARPWLEQGLALAQRVGNAKAHSELTEALARLGE